MVPAPGLFSSVPSGPCSPLCETSARLPSSASSSVAVAPLSLPLLETAFGEGDLASGGCVSSPFDLGFSRQGEMFSPPAMSPPAISSPASAPLRRCRGLARRTPRSLWVSDVRPRPLTAPAAPLLAPLEPSTIESKVRIRFTRRGRKKLPFYRLVAVDARKARDAKPIEQLGWYDPRRKTHTVDVPAVQRWMDCGAEPSDTVRGLLVRIGALDKKPYVPPPATPPRRWSRSNPYPGSKRWRELHEGAAPAAEPTNAEEA